jgi:transcriptional regulator with PAS, ATPase and Fis domain
MLNRPLPVPIGANGQSSGNGDFQERELLYKVLFDMKNDLNDLKSLIYELVKSNNLRMPDLGSVRQLQQNLPNLGFSNQERESSNPPVFEQSQNEVFYPAIETGKITPIIIDQGKSNTVFTKTEVEDAPLAMDEIEKEAIKRSLKKYNGRRKEAAEELKISERTLYRKIKQYNLQ